MEKSNHAEITGSLPVENVQALASTYNRSHENKNISERYIRPEIEHDEVVYINGVDLPVIDLVRLNDPQFYQEESAKLRAACEEWGFFQLINHGAPDEVIDKMRADIIEFFEQPLEQKKMYSQLPNSIEGYGQAFVVSEDQKLDWGDMFYLIVRPVSSRNMRFWPINPPTFRDSLERFSQEMKEIAGRLFELIAKDLGVAAEVLLSVFKDLPQSLRMNYYPPCPQADQVLGLSPHSDGVVGLTLLLQVNNVHGLEIKKAGKWVAVQALPRALIVNVGDILEIVSNGRYKSMEHRAMTNTKRERISAAVFHLAHENSIVGPLPELVKGGEVLYKTVGFLDYAKCFFAAKLDGKSHLSFSGYFGSSSKQMKHASLFRRMKKC